MSCEHCGCGLEKRVVDEMVLAVCKECGTVHPEEELEVEAQERQGNVGGNEEVME